MQRIDAVLLDRVSQEAKESLRLRMNYNFHASPTEAMQRMLNAFEPGTYLRPHRHPDREEIFIIFRGRMVLLIFDDSGTIIDRVLLCAEEGSYGVEIPPMTWHTLFIVESNTVMYELKRGPYEPLAEEHFASWSPCVGDVEKINDYLKMFESQVNDIF